MNYFTDEYKHLWKLSKYPPSFYQLFGFVFNDYASTYKPSENRLQLFSVSFNKLFEKSKVDDFHKICCNFFEETAIKNDLKITEKTDNFEHNTTFYFISHAICNHIQSIDYKEETDLFISLIKPTFGTFPLALNQRMEFLTGTYLFHHREKEAIWFFYNNYDKACLVHKFMVQLSDETDEICFTTTFRTPSCHRIELNEEGRLWKTIKERLK